jgi:hypothetical protein
MTQYLDSNEHATNTHQNEEDIQISPNSNNQGSSNTTTFDMLEETTRPSVIDMKKSNDNTEHGNDSSMMTVSTEKLLAAAFARERKYNEELAKKDEQIKQLSEASHVLDIVDKQMVESRMLSEEVLCQLEAMTRRMKQFEDRFASKFGHDDVTMKDSHSSLVQDDIHYNASYRGGNIDGKSPSDHPPKLTNNAICIAGSALCLGVACIVGPHVSLAVQSATLFFGSTIGAVMYQKEQKQYDEVPDQ